jgi:hypothetical protein
VVANIGRYNNNNTQHNNNNTTKQQQQQTTPNTKPQALLTNSPLLPAPIVSWVANQQTGAINHALVNVSATGELGLQSSPKPYPDLGALVNAHKKTLQTPLSRDVGYEIGVMPGCGHAPPPPPHAAGGESHSATHAVAPSSAVSSVASVAISTLDSAQYASAQTPARFVQSTAKVPEPTVPTAPGRTVPATQPLQPARAAPMLLPPAASPQRTPYTPKEDEQGAYIEMTLKDRQEAIDMDTGGDGDDDDPLSMLAAMAGDDAVPAELPLPPDTEEDIGFASEDEEDEVAVVTGDTAVPTTTSYDHGAGATPYATEAPTATASLQYPAQAQAMSPPADLQTREEYLSVEPLTPTPLRTPMATDRDTPEAETGNLVDDVLQQGLNYLDVTRKQSEDALLRSPPGSYLVRPSSQENCLALTYVTEVPGGRGGQIGHLLLKNQPTVGWTTEGRSSPYRTLRELLESLPYALKLRPLQAGGGRGGGSTVTTAASPVSSVDASAAAAYAAQVLAQQQAEAQKRIADEAARVTEAAARERRYLDEQRQKIAAEQAEVARQKAELEAERKQLAVAAERISTVQAAAAASTASTAPTANGRPTAHTTSTAVSPAAAAAVGRMASPSSPAAVSEQTKRQIRRTTRTERGLSTTVQELKNGDATPAAPQVHHANFGSPRPPCQICGVKPMATKVNPPGMEARLTCVDCMQQLTKGKPVTHTTAGEPFIMVHTAPVVSGTTAAPVGMPPRR